MLTLLTVEAHTDIFFLFELRAPEVTFVFFVCTSQETPELSI